MGFIIFLAILSVSLIYLCGWLLIRNDRYKRDLNLVEQLHSLETSIANRHYRNECMYQQALIDIRDQNNDDNNFKTWAKQYASTILNRVYESDNS